MKVILAIFMLLLVTRANFILAADTLNSRVEEKGYHLRHLQATEYGRFAVTAGFLADGEIEAGIAIDYGPLHLGHMRAEGVPKELRAPFVPSIRSDTLKDLPGARADISLDPGSLKGAAYTSENDSGAALLVRKNNFEAWAWKVFDLGGHFQLTPFSCHSYLSSSFDPEEEALQDELPVPMHSSPLWYAGIRFAGGESGTAIDLLLVMLSSRIGKRGYFVRALMESKDIILPGSGLALLGRWGSPAFLASEGRLSEEEGEIQFRFSWQNHLMSVYAQGGLLRMRRLPLPSAYIGLERNAAGGISLHCWHMELSGDGEYRWNWDYDGGPLSSLEWSLRLEVLLQDMRAGIEGKKTIENGLPVDSVMSVDCTCSFAPITIDCTAASDYSGYIKAEWLYDSVSGSSAFLRIGFEEAKSGFLELLMSAGWNIEY